MPAQDFFDTGGGRNLLWARNVFYAIEMKPTSRSRFSRMRTGVACILLLGFVCSSSFDAAHSHTNVSPEIRSGSTQQANITACPHNHSRDDECVICLFHRQFSKSTLHVSSSITAPVPEISSASTALFFYEQTSIISNTLARPSGRGPPVHRA